MKVGVTATVAVAVLLLVGQSPLLSDYLTDLGRREQYAFYPMLLLATGVLGFLRLREIPADSFDRGGWWLTASLLVAALGLSLAGGLLYLRWLAAPTAMLTLAAVVWRLGHWPLARALAPCGLLVLVVTPPPMRLDADVTFALRGLAVRLGSRTLDLLGQHHVVTGTVIEIPARRLMVEEACSGINSLLSVVAFTLLFAFVRRRRAGAVVALVVAAVVFVVWANVVRIVLGAVLLGRYGIDLFDNALHELSGLALFIVCLLLVASTDHLLHLLGRLRQVGAAVAGTAGLPPPAGPIPSTGVTARASLPPPPTPVAGAAFAPAYPGPAWWAFALAFAAVGAFNHHRLKDCWLPSRLDPAAVFSPPLAVGDWRLVPEATTARERTESFAKYSKRWFYRDGRTTAEVSLAYPFFDGQHDPAACYAAAGWAVGPRADHPGPADGGRVSRRSLSKLATTRGHLVYGAFDEAGRWLGPLADAPSAGGRWADALRLSRQVALARPTHEVQTLIVTSSDPDPAEQGRAEALFLAVSRDLARQVAGQVDNRGGGDRP